MYGSPLNPRGLSVLQLRRRQRQALAHVAKNILSVVIETGLAVSLFAICWASGMVAFA